MLRMKNFHAALSEKCGYIYWRAFQYRFIRITHPYGRTGNRSSNQVILYTHSDAHIYLNHLEQVNLQLSREFRPLPVMKINPAIKDIFNFKFEDFELSGYDPHPNIKAQVAV